MICFSTELEDISASISGSTTLSIRLSGIGSRHISNGEVKYLDPLVKKHGGNLKSMAADLKLNPEQRTVGQLRRALIKAGLVTQG
jgi:nucleolar protein 16